MSVTYLRKATPNDITTIIKIIDQAKEMMKKAGSPQWQDGHPDQAMISHDVQCENGWVLMVGPQIAGYAVLQLTPEPTYQHIREGHWEVNDQPYITIHRVAISNQFRGHHLSKFLFSNLITIGLAHGITNFRLDTHKVNKPMQGLAHSFGFHQRGLINVNDKYDPVRLAFELNLTAKSSPHGHVNNDFMTPLTKPTH